MFFPSGLFPRVNLKAASVPCDEPAGVALQGLAEPSADDWGVRSRLDWE